MENDNKVIDAVMAMVLSTNINMIDKLEKKVKEQNAIIEKQKGAIGFWQHLSWALATLVVVALLSR